VSQWARRVHFRQGLLERDCPALKSRINHDARFFVDKLVRFTKHAEQKFSDLATLQFTITREQFIDTILHPDNVIRSQYPPIAQKVISTSHILRVVFVESDDDIVVVTFYPGRKTRYE